MLKGSVISAAFAVAACQAGPPQNCEVAAKQALECGERNSENGKEVYLRCFPFSKPERIAGAWAYGFETNEFYEDQRASVSLVNKAIGDTGLDLEGTEGLAEGQGDAIIVYQMEFIGRRSRCDMLFPRHLIVVDRVISKREAARRPHW